MRSLTAAVAFPLSLAACTGAPQKTVEVADLFPDELLEQAWTVHMTTEEGKSRYFSDAWVQHTVKRKYCNGIKAVGANGGLVAA